MVHQLYLDVLQTLDRLDIPYVIIGAFAGYTYGVTRVTADVDMVVDMAESHIQALASAYPSPRYYADPDQMRRCIRSGKMFNIIDSNVGRKVDLVPVTMKPGYGFALKNRVRRDVPGKQPTQAWFARPEDIIIGKLMAWDNRRAFKDESDIRDILTAVKLGEDMELTNAFDLSYIDDWMMFLSEDVQLFWHNMKIVVEI